MNVKNLGQVFTPFYVVEFILKAVGYEGENIINSRILEPSAGDGNFVLQIVDKLVSYANEKGLSNSEILKLIKKNVFAIELDNKKYDDLMSNVISKIKSHGIDVTLKDLHNNIIKGDSLNKEWGFDFDFIVGNPPYVRLHNLNKDYIEWLRKEFISMKKGSVDLYYAFIEDGYNKLSKNGKLCFITPNNFLINNSGLELRRLLNDKFISVYDFQSYQIFEGASTYNSIFTISKNSVDNPKAFLPKVINNVINKGKKLKLINFNEKLIIEKTNNPLKIINIKKPNLNFKNGLATLADSIYISEDVKKISNKIYKFNGWDIEAELIKPVVKISTNTKKYAIFPYKEIEGRQQLITEEEIILNYPKAYKYFLNFEKELKSRSLENRDEWYAFGRTQAINSINHKKVIINTLVKDEIKFHKVPKGSLVYSGLYSEYNETWEKISDFLSSKELYEFVITLGSDKRGEYKQFNSTTLREVMNG